jgi:hypothetical protein
LNIRRQRRLGGLPAGEVISADNMPEDCPILVSYRCGLKGKPDALVRTPSGELIPVERKKKRAPSKGPYDGDLIQATAYCILVEEHYGHTPPFMRIQYADRWFDEPYTLQRKHNDFGILNWALPQIPCNFKQFQIAQTELNINVLCCSGTWLVPRAMCRLSFPIPSL